MPIAVIVIAIFAALAVSSWSSSSERAKVGVACINAGGSYSYGNCTLPPKAKPGASE